MHMELSVDFHFSSAHRLPVLRRGVLPAARAQLQAQGDRRRRPQPEGRDDSRLRGDPPKVVWESVLEPVRPPQPQRLHGQPHRREPDRLDVGAPQAPGSRASRSCACGKPPSTASATARSEDVRARAAPIARRWSARSPTSSPPRASTSTDPNLAEHPGAGGRGLGLDEFLDGYRTTPEEALGERYPAPPGTAGEMVVVTELRFHSMCPHHLLPYEGVAHVAYVPHEHRSSASAGSRRCSTASRTG